MTRLLVDEALPRSLASHLREAGHEAEHVLDLGLRGQPDERVFSEAQRREAVLITADLDFTDIRRFPPSRHRGVVLVRLPSVLSVARVLETVARALRDASLPNLERSILVIEPSRTRLRRFE